ncbi:sulfite exporter TauE/SafE family protein [bacterium]|nr:sulfite exporter TauE/SafE family protein [bacterium]
MFELHEFVLVSIIGLLAFYLKGLMGTGTTTVLVSLCSFFLEPKSCIVIASFINVFGGFAMLKIDSVTLPKPFWLPITIAMVVGSVLGAQALSLIDPMLFKLVLGVIFLLVSLWFLLSDVAISPNEGRYKVATMADLLIAAFAGLCGGFIGINAPLLVIHFGSYLPKEFLRKLLVIIFIPAAIAQTSTFWINGLLSIREIVLSLTIIPMMLVGVHLGNRAFISISAKQFRIALGLLLMAASMPLLSGSA